MSYITMTSKYTAFSTLEKSFIANSHTIFLVLIVSSFCTLSEFEHIVKRHSAPRFSLFCLVSQFYSFYSSLAYSNVAFTATAAAVFPLSCICINLPFSGCMLHFFLLIVLFYDSV